ISDEDEWVPGPNAFEKRKKAFQEPTRPSDRSLPCESGAEDARTPDASRLPGVSELREAFGVRPIYRRFSSGAGRPAVQGPNGGATDIRHLAGREKWIGRRDVDSTRLAAPPDFFEAHGRLAFR